MAPAPINRGARPAIVPVRKPPVPAPPVARISDTLAATQVAPENAIMVPAKKPPAEFVELGATQVVGENEYAEKVQREKEALKNAATLVVVQEEEKENEQNFDEEGDTQKLEDDPVEEVKQPAKAVDIEKAKWTLSSSVINQSSSGSAEYLRFCCCNRIRRKIFNSLGELFGGGAGAANGTGNRSAANSDLKLRERILTSPKKNGQCFPSFCRKLLTKTDSEENGNKKKEDTKAKGRFYKPASNKPAPKDEDDKSEAAAAAQKRPFPAENLHPKRLKKDSASGPSAAVIEIPQPVSKKDHYRVMITGGTRLAEYKKVRGVFLMQLAVYKETHEKTR